MLTMTLGEISNFAAYSFAPAILVTPLGALSVLISAILASWLLNERLGTVGKASCALCLLGAIVVVLHAPEDKELVSVDEILNYAIQPGFLSYCVFVLCFTLYMIFRVVPEHGKRFPIVYISICSLVGSVSVMAVKGFGIALKLTLTGSNQFTHPSTYLFAAVVLTAVLTQVNYFNKALEQFSTNIVTPIYYVFFTTATIFASVILFGGFDEPDARDTLSLCCGFITIFIGVFLLNNATRMEYKSGTILMRTPNARRRQTRAHSAQQSLSSSLSGYARVDTSVVGVDEDDDEEDYEGDANSSTPRAPLKSSQRVELNV